MGDDFRTTHWSVVLDAARDETPAARAALEALCKAYWYPLYAHARKKGHDADAAGDATQDFFARQVITGAVFKGISPGRGRFRAWLQQAMNHHLLNLHDAQTAQKRGGGIAAVPLDDFEKAEGLYRASGGDRIEAEQVFERAWAMSVLKRARALLEEKYRGRAELYAELQRFLPGDEGSLSDAAAKLGKTLGATKTAVSRLRDDFGDAVRFEISRTVSHASEVDDDIRALIAAVSA